MLCPNRIGRRVGLPHYSQVLVRDRGVGLQDRTQVRVDDLLIELRSEEGIEVECRKQRVLPGAHRDECIVDP